MNNEDRREMLNDFFNLAVDVKVELESMDDLTDSESDIIYAIETLLESFANLACEENE